MVAGGAETVAFSAPIWYHCFMKKKTTVYEDKLEREEKRRRRAEEYARKHTVACPQCGRGVLDHMEKCPYCGGKLTPAGYTPMSKKKLLLIRGILFVVLMAVAIVILVFFVK